MRRARGIAGAAIGILGLFAWLMPTPVRGQERVANGAALDHWLFRSGRVEVGMQVGGGFSVAEHTRNASLFTFLPRVGYVFTQQSHFLPGSLEIVGEPAYIVVFERKTAHVGGLSALLKYNFWTGSRWTPFVEGGGGVSFASHRVPQEGTNFNFLTQIGLGFQYAISPRAALSLAWRYHHFSNADISPPNPSLNSSLFFVGFSYFY